MSSWRCVHQRHSAGTALYSETPLKQPLSLWSRWTCRWKRRTCCFRSNCRMCSICCGRCAITKHSAICSSHYYTLIGIPITSFHFRIVTLTWYFWICIRKHRNENTVLQYIDNALYVDGIGVVPVGIESRVGGEKTLSVIVAHRRIRFAVEGRDWASKKKA